MDDAVSYLLIRYPTVTCDYSVIFKSHGEWLWSRTHGNLEDAEAEVAFAKNLYKEVMLLKDTSPQMAYRACLQAERSDQVRQVDPVEAIKGPVSWHSRLQAVFHLQVLR